MFRINPAPTFDASVRLTVPGQDAPAVLQLTFAHMGRKAAADWIERAKGRSDADVIGEVVRDWKDVQDDAGAPVPYSREALAALLDAHPAAGMELFDAYLAALSESRAKNSG